VPGQLAGCGGQVTGVSTRRGQLVELARVITASPALLTREQQIFARLTDSLAQLIAEDTGEASGAVEPWVAANAHMGVHRGLVAHVRRLILAGARDDALAAAIRAEAERALGLVEHGPTAPSACSAEGVRRPSLRRKLRRNKHRREAHCDAVP
jgi:hypothetical protein